EDTIDRTYDVISGALPERVALAGIRIIKSQATRKDMLGEVAYRTLKLVNGGLERALQTLNRFENASEPPARQPRRSRRSARSRATTAPSRARRSVPGSGSSTRSSSRRPAGEGRRRAPGRSTAAVRRSA